uniref:hypothetical protein n=2 Tax=Escherichia coli TaxID=562 RepID=UPI003D7F591D
IKSPVLCCGENITFHQVAKFSVPLHVHDIAVPEGVWCDRNRKVYPVSFGPSDSLLQPVAHGFVSHGP